MDHLHMNMTVLMATLTPTSGDAAEDVVQEMRALPQSLQQYADKLHLTLNSGVQELEDKLGHACNTQEQLAAKVDELQKLVAQLAAGAQQVGANGCVSTGVLLAAEVFVA
jgi:hypothetical protein